MKRSKKILLPVISYKFFISAILSTLSLSCILFIFALLNDRGKSATLNRLFGNARLSYSLEPINTKLFDDTKTFFDLKDDTEWRLANSRVSKRYRRNVDDGVRNTIELTVSDDDDFDCEAVAKMVPSMSFLAAGWTKAVYKAKFNDVDLAVKTVDVTGQDVNQCLEKQRHDNEKYLDVERCYHKAAKKIIKEIALLKQLQHPNVIKVLGYCIPKKPDAKDSRLRVAIVTELGEPVNLIRLLQLSWEDRLRIVLSLVRLLNYLADHQLGSLVMNDMRRQQFVVVNGELKLVDVDDIGIEEPKCHIDQDCATYMMNLNSNNIKTNNTSTLPNLECKHGYCQGFNEIRNIFNAARHFTTFLLPYGAPFQLQDSVKYIVENFQNQSLKSPDLLQLVEALTKNYSTGSYLSDDTKADKVLEFVEIRRNDMTGLHDYSCQGSRTQISCSLSMASVSEAESLCSAQPVCRAFVWTDEKSWTGRNIVHFKNNVSSPVHNENTILYVKV